MCHEGYHDKCGRISEYCGGVQYHGDIMSTVGDIMSTVGVILSTVGDTQYSGGYHDAHGDVMSNVREIFCYLSTPMVLNTPKVPPRYSDYKEWYPPWY